jgi:hypothetical protein
VVGLDDPAELMVLLRATALILPGERCALRV